MRLIILLFAPLLLVSCATTSGQKNAISQRAVFDLNCKKEMLTIELIQSSAGHDTYGVSGCDQRATYIVTGDVVNGYYVVANSPDNKK